MPSKSSSSMEPLKLYARPHAPHTQKVLIALYENDIPFERIEIDSENSVIMDGFAELWPFQHFPALVLDGEVAVEASIIIEYLDIYWSDGVRFIPDDPHAALRVRMMDRFFDNYITTNVQKIVEDSGRTRKDQDPYGVEAAYETLESSYAWLETELADKQWAQDDVFSLADCSAATALFYADWVKPIPPELEELVAYRKRLMARPSIARMAKEARPRQQFLRQGFRKKDETDSNFQGA